MPSSVSPTVRAQVSCLSSEPQSPPLRTGAPCAPTRAAGAAPVSFVRAPVGLHPYPPFPFLCTQRTTLS